jgi:hypothetical protein
VAEGIVHTPFPTGTPWLARAVVVSAVVHALAVLVLHVTLSPGEEHQVDVVDIEIAPPPPKAEALPAERATPPSGARETDTAAVKPPEPTKPVEGLVDAGVDAAPKKASDAAVDAGVDAGIDAGIDAGVDAGVDAPADAEAVAQSGSGTGTGSGSGSGDAGVPAAVAMGSGSGQPGMTDEPAVAGDPTSPGTAANLLAYFPPGHVVTALIRFDRLRGTEWAEQTERLLEPLPDYHGLFGGKSAKLGDRLDTLVISSPRPRDATATTLVAHTPMSRPDMRTFLADGAPITWSTARGGMLGKRQVKAVPGASPGSAGARSIPGGNAESNDRRMVLSPWKNWFVLAQPEDLGALVAAGGGKIDAIEARGKLPPWLDTIRTIEKESGDDPKTGPALVVTLAGDGKRYALPDVGLGITSLPAPERVSIAVELDPKGWRVRGNMKFASEADAAEVVASLKQAQQRIADSRVLSVVLRSQHLYNAIIGLSLSRTGDRVSYGTSASIGDARAVLAAAAATLDRYFGHTP